MEKDSEQNSIPRSGQQKNSMLSGNIFKCVSDYFIKIYQAFMYDRCLLTAGSLAYVTVLSLIPLTAISLSIMTSFLNLSEMDLTALEAPQSVETSATGEKSLNSPSAASLDFDQRNYVIEEEENQSLIETKFQEFIQAHFLPSSIPDINRKITQLSHNMRALNFLSVIILIITSLMLLNTIEHAFNHIWQVAKTRTFFVKFLAFWTALTLTPLLIGLSIFITAKMESLSIYQSLQHIKVGMYIFEFLVTFGLTWLAFSVVYRLLPYTDVSWRAAGLGALIGGGIWELCKIGFDHYVKQVAVYNILYGSLGIIPIFLIWIYLTWAIVLFGAEAAAVYQFQRKKFVPRGNWGSHREYLAAKIMLEIARPFEKGDMVPSVAGISNILSIPEELVVLLCKGMEDRDLLIAVDGREPKYMPALALNNITLGSIVRSVGDHTITVPELSPESEDKHLVELLRSAENGTYNILDSATLENLCEEYEHSKE